MEYEEISFEDFVKSKGWKLIKGFKLDINSIKNIEKYKHIEHIYFDDLKLDDSFKKCSYWRHKDNENIYEDIDLLIKNEFEPEFKKINEKAFQIQMISFNKKK